jgi:hypothetical protein
MGFRHAVDLRQRLGQVPTPPDVADAMARWVLARTPRPRSLLEPGAGGFVFARAALAIAPDLRVTGVELDPAQPSLRGARRVLGDFLKDETLPRNARFDAILCNPPYVRHHFLDPAYKRALGRRFGVSGLAGTHVHFLLRALELAAPGARLAFLTGAEWLEARYGDDVRRRLVERGWLRAVLVADPREEIFPGVLSTAAVLLLEHAPGAPAAHAAGLSRAELLRAIDHPEQLRPWAPPPPDEDTIPLGALFRVRRGIATGANAFFVLDDDEVRERALPRRHLVRCLATPRDLRPRWLLSLDDRPRDRLPAAVRAYLGGGEAQGLDQRYLCRTRRPWYRLERVTPAPLLVGYMARGALTVVRNHDAALHLNLLHGVYPRPGTPPALVDALADFLRSERGLAAARAASRTYAGGLHKLEPRDLEAVRVPRAWLTAPDAP